MKIKTPFATQIKRIFENMPPRTAEACYLVNYDGGPSSVLALRQACAMASAGTKVVAVYLEVVPQDQRLEGDPSVRSLIAQAVLAAAIVNAQLYNVNIETSSLRCRVQGPALVNLAAERGSSVLFLGVDEWESNDPLNPFADYVLALAPCKVVLVGQNDTKESFE